VGLAVGVALMVGQLFYPSAKELPPISMLQCNNITRPDQEFIFPVDPVYE